MKGLLQVEGGDAVLPIVCMFYGAPSQHFWEDVGGIVVHHIPQGEGGERRRTHATPLRRWAPQGRSCFRSVACGRALLRVP